MKRTGFTKSIKVGDVVSIFRRGRVWYAQYQLEGRQHRPSLGTIIKKAALKMAGDLERQLTEGRMPRKPVKVPVGTVVNEFLASVRNSDLSKSTICHYKSALTAFTDLLASRHLLWLSQIDLPLVDDFQSVLRGHGLGKKTVGFKVGVIRALVLFAMRRKYLESNPIIGLRIPKSKASPQPFWPWDQVLTILKASPPAYRAVFTILAHTGMRIGEALHLEWVDVDCIQQAIHIRAKEGWKPKSGEDRIVKMSRQLADVLGQLPHTQRWVLARKVTAPHGRPCTAVTSARAALAALKKVLTDLALKGRLHTFRHSFISHALTKGTPEAVVRSWVGHVDPAVIRIYTHVADQISTTRMNQLFDDSSDKSGS